MYSTMYVHSTHLSSAVPRHVRTQVAPRLPSVRAERAGVFALLAVVPEDMALERALLGARVGAAGLLADERPLSGVGPDLQYM